MKNELLNQLLDLLIDWVKSRSVSVCGVNIICADDLVKKLKQLRQE